MRDTRWGWGEQLNNNYNLAKRFREKTFFIRKQKIIKSNLTFVNIITSTSLNEVPIINYSFGRNRYVRTSKFGKKRPSI